MKTISLTLLSQIDNARSKAKLDERIPALIDNGKQQLEEGKNKLEDGKKQLDGFRKEARDQLNATVDKVDRTVEEKAAEAKGTVSGWFGGKK
jgi:predicted phage tail protein